MGTKAKTAGGVVGFALAMLLAVHFEGEVQYTYLDVNGVPTACFGDTHDVQVGQTFTHDECVARLTVRMKQAWDAVPKCVKVDMTDDQHAALADFVYNVGQTAFCSSKLVQLANLNQWFAACDQLLRWKYAGGRSYPGLVKRRIVERQACLGQPVDFDD